MALTLAEFETMCLHGPLEAVTPATFMEAQRLLNEMETAYFRRKDAYNDQWRLPARAEQHRNRRGQFCRPSFRKEMCK